MHKSILVLNLLALSLLSLLARVVIEPAYNLLELYGEAKADLPMPTHWAIQLRSYSVLIPLTWAVLAYYFIR